MSSSQDIKVFFKTLAWLASTANIEKQSNVGRFDTTSIIKLRSTLSINVKTASKGLKENHCQIAVIFGGF
jgi:hypothetical protein